MMAHFVGLPFLNTWSAARATALPKLRREQAFPAVHEPTRVEVVGTVRM